MGGEGGGNKPMRICKSFTIKIFKAIEERHENSPTPKSPDFTGQGNVRFVCSSVFIFRHIRISPQKYEISQISKEYQRVFFYEKDNSDERATHVARTYPINRADLTYFMSKESLMNG